jgi:hypothetical protein
MRSRFLLAAALLGAALVAAVAFVAVRDGDEPPVRDAQPERCAGLPSGAARSCLTQEFLAVLDGRDDPRQALLAIAAAVRRQGGPLLSDCHGIMHTVGRTYARDAGVTLANLRDHLPRSNDPGCPAGFAHGLVTGVAPLIDPREPRVAAGVCAEEETRYLRYSCVHGLGHAFMRIHEDRLEPALELCRALGPRQAPDCAQGAYHDYWFAVVGADDATLPDDADTEPRALCGAQPEAFVRPCWYRAFVDNRPAGIVVDSPEHFQVLCENLSGVQRAGCITAVSVIGPADPAAQLGLCAQLPAADAADCVRGTKVQNLLDATTDEWVRLISRCDLLEATTRAACYRWLGKTLAVVTDGAFGEIGCPRLDADAARRQCRAGADTMEGALVTFS